MGGLDDLFDGVVRVEEVGVLDGLAGDVRRGACAPLVGFDEEAEVGGDGAGVAAEAVARGGSVVGAVDADGAEEGVLGVGAQALLGEGGFVGLAAEDEALPTGEGPGGGAEAEGVGEFGCELVDRGVELRGGDGRWGVRSVAGLGLGLREVGEESWLLVWFGDA